MYGYRSYGHGGFGGTLPKAVKALLIANGIVFLLMMLLPYRLWNVLFGLVPDLITTRFMVWQFFTYMFLHGGFAHIFFNMFGLWMFGRELEYNWGTKDFLYYYFTCGIGGGVLVWLTSLINFSPGNVPTVGASGAVFGILVAYGLMWPNRMIFVMGILPMKALHFVIVFGAIELMNGLTRAGGNVAYFAHVGGAVTGFVYLKFGWRMMAHIESWWKRFRAGRAAKEWKFTIHEGGKKTKSSQDSTSRPHPDHDAEVDRILDKIAREGMDSLTDRERKILDGASKRRKQ